MISSYKYRIYPNKEQEVLIMKHFGCARWVYNYGLNLKIETYTKNKKAISRFDIQAKLPILKAMEETKWLADVMAQSLQASLEHLDKSFTAFFKYKKGFPRFKSKFHRQSFQYPTGLKVDFNKQICYLPKIGWVKTILSRQFTGKIKTCTVSKTYTGKYFISILVDNSIALPELKPINPETTIGIDTGIKTFATLSNGKTFDNPRFLRNSLTRLKILQRRASRKKKGSKNKKKANLRVAILHEKIANQRLDYIHKVTSRIIGENQASAICIEDLNVKGMMANHKLAQAISDVSLAKFYEILKYKCEWAGINLIKIGRLDPSSKACSTCGVINKELTLKDRSWTCACGIAHDRDLNAAINIKNWGLHPKNSRAGCSGAPVESLTVVGSVKQEKKQKAKAK